MAASSQSYDSPTAPKIEPPKPSYAFLVHSADTMNHGLPPDVDNKPLARQKRRRTSPEDQAILEAEYLKNPKPDKAARMDIVRRVALGEKEVQIWFQNRRQSSRRKSRPLLPHEIAQYQTSRAHLGDFSPSVDGPASQESVTESDGKQEEEDDNPELEPSPSQTQVPTSQHEAPVPLSFENNLNASVVVGDMSSSQVIPSSQESTSGRMGYLANRRSTAPRPSQDEAEFETVPASQESVTDVQPARRQLRKSSSVVRLSMTSNGVAKIITDGDSSPSPPRKRPSEPPSSSAPAVYEVDRRASVQNAGLAESPSQTANQGTGSLRRKPSGRSRDSRAWEFWCDRDARSELEEKADQETSGSAADAIGLIRSNSGRNILGSLVGKRDSPFRESTSAKRTKTSRTPLLQRAQSFQNRPMARSSLGGKPTQHTPRILKKAVSGLGIRMSTTDSDKENWSPDRIIPASERSIRTVEREDGQCDNRNTNLGAFRSTKLAAATPRTVEDPEDDEELADFMARGRQSKSNSVSEEEELDCVQGLLSLSQGNWR